MNSRERLRRCYFLEALDRPGVFVRTNYPPNDPSYDQVKAYLAENTELKRNWGPPVGRYGSRLEESTEPYSEDFERRVTLLHTPAGDLRATRLVGLKGQPGLGEEYLLKTPEDAQKYLRLPIPKGACDVSGFFERDRAVGDRGIAEAHLGSNPGGIVGRLFGSEAFAILSVTDREVLHRLCEREQKILIEKTKFLLSKGVGPYFALVGQELITPPLHGPKDFQDFI